MIGNSLKFNEKTSLIFLILTTLLINQVFGTSKTHYPVLNTGAVGMMASISGSKIAFHTAETWMDEDLNRDGDKDDYIIRYYDTLTGKTVNTREIGLEPSVYVSIITFPTAERWAGQDYNKDEDLNDIIIKYYIASTQTSIITGESGEASSISDNIIAFHTGEKCNEEDFNRDGDTSDYVIKYYDVNSKVTVNTRITGYAPSVSGSIIVFHTYEWMIEQDLNIDGDTGDIIIRYYDTTTGKTINTGNIGEFPCASGSIIAYHTAEEWTGEDFSEDGDDDDIVIRYTNLLTGNTVNTGQVGLLPSVSGAIITFHTAEGWINEDLNKDGDTNDIIIRFYNTSNGKTVNTGTAGHSPSISGSTIAFHTFETWIGEDLNSDGDMKDSVIRYLSISKNLENDYSRIIHDFVSSHCFIYSTSIMLSR